MNNSSGLSADEPVFWWFPQKNVQFICARLLNWTDRRTDKIQRANLDGSNIEDVIATGLLGPSDIALALDGSDVEVLLSGIQRCKGDCAGSNLLQTLR